MSLPGTADTGAIIALLDPDEQHHAWAVDEFRRFPSLFRFPSLLTCEVVITEACFLARRQHEGEARVVGLPADRVLEIAFSLRGEEERIGQLMATYAVVCP